MVHNRMGNSSVYERQCLSKHIIRARSIRKPKQPELSEYKKTVCLAKFLKGIVENPHPSAFLVYKLIILYLFRRSKKGNVL